VYYNFNFVIVSVRKVARLELQEKFYESQYVIAPLNYVESLYLVLFGSVESHFKIMTELDI
jgi:hypothetical protein